MPRDLHAGLGLTVNSSETLCFLVRHAQTEWNLDRRFQGHLDVPLSAVGRCQAKALASWLDSLGINFGGLYTSDLLRAAQTAEAISTIVGLQSQPVEALREIHCGEWQGLLVSEIETLFPGKLNEWRTEVDNCVMTGGESLRQVQERIGSFLMEVMARHAGASFIVVSHGAALSTLIAKVTNLDLAECWRNGMARLDNTGVTVVAYNCSTQYGRVLLSNYVGHLDTLNSIEQPVDGWPA